MSNVRASDAHIALGVFCGVSCGVMWFCVSHAGCRVSGIEPRHLYIQPVVPYCSSNAGNTHSVKWNLRESQPQHIMGSPRNAYHPEGSSHQCRPLTWGFANGCAVEPLRRFYPAPARPGSSVGVRKHLSPRTKVSRDTGIIAGQSRFLGVIRAWYGGPGGGVFLGIWGRPLEVFASLSSRRHPDDTDGIIVLWII